MRRFGLVVVILAGLAAIAATQHTGTPESTRYTRACTFPAGGWATVDCSAAAAYSAQLSPWTRYAIQCTGDAYFATDDAASGADADGNDGYIPAGAWVEILTNDSIRYYTCEASGSGGVCRHIECQ